MKAKILLMGSLISFFCLFGCDKEDVKDVAIQSITVASSVNDLEIGGEVEVTATVTPSDAVGTVTWASANGSVATVTAKDGTNGRTAIIKAVSAGTTTISASSGNIKSGNLSVTVKEAPPVVIRITAITITSSVADLEIDETVEVEATVTPANTTETIEWVAVDGTGKVTVEAIAGSDNKRATVTAVSAGTAQVYAKCGTVESAKLDVTVLEPEPPEPTEDYASDVEGTYYGEGSFSNSSIPGLDGAPVTDVEIILERVNNGTLDMTINANLPALAAMGVPVNQELVSTVKVSSDYELTGETSINAGFPINFTLTGKVNPDEGTITLKLSSALLDMNLTAAMSDLDDDLDDFASDIAGTYKGDGVASEGALPGLDGPVTNVSIVLEKLNNTQVSAEVTATLPLIGLLLGPSVMTCTLDVSPDYELSGTASLDNPVDPTDAFVFTITGSVDTEAKTIELKFFAANRITLDLTAEME